MARDGIALKKLTDLVFDDPCQGDQVHRAIVEIWQSQDTRQHARHGDDTHGGLPILFEEHTNTEGFIENTGKGVSRVDDDRCQDRFKLASPIAANEGEVLALQLIHFPQMDLLGGQCGEQTIVPA